MSYPINYPTPQGANIQIFQGGDVTTAGHNKTRDWVKPQGASFVWFTLIGAGGDGDSSTSGGGSGAVTNFMGPAFLIPDRLIVTVGKGGVGVNGGSTYVFYQEKNGTGYTLLGADGGQIGGNSPTPANAFTAMGFYQNVVGQAGSSSTVNASATTFLSGGAFTGQVDANYDYRITNGYSGSFQTQPIIVGNGGSVDGTGGIGCGGGVTGKGGDGLVVIITW
jgi:hypothetical protein